MTMIIRSTLTRLPIPELFRAVLKFIYEKDKCSYATESMVKNSVVNWYKWVKEQKQKEIEKFGLQASHFAKIGTKGTIVDEIEYQLEGMAWLLREDELGHLDARKKTFKEHGIDYRKFYKIPEAFKPSDFVKAKKALEKAKRDNPQDYE